MVLVHQRVARRHTAVHQPDAVSALERIGHLGQEREGVSGREPTLSCRIRKRGPVHPLHREVHNPFALGRVVDGDHVAVVEARRPRQLVAQPPDEPGVRRPLGRQDLQRHRPVEADLGRPVDDAVGPAPDLGLDAEVEQLPTGGEDVCDTRGRPGRGSRTFQQFPGGPRVATRGGPPARRRRPGPRLAPRARSPRGPRDGGPTGTATPARGGSRGSPRMQRRGLPPWPPAIRRSPRAAARGGRRGSPRTPRRGSRRGGTVTRALRRRARRRSR